MRISPLELESGEARIYESQYYCAGCAREVIPVAKAARKLAAAPPAQRPKEPAGQRLEVKPGEREEPLAVGQTVSLFDGETLSGWKIVGNVTCKVENGEIVVKNNAAVGEGGIFTDYEEQQRWLDYEFTISINSSPGSGWRLVLRANPGQSNVIAGNSLRAGEGFPANTWRTVTAEVAGNSLYIKMGGLRKLLSSAVEERPGAVAVLTKPRAEVRIRNVRLTLRAVK